MKIFKASPGIIFAHSPSLTNHFETHPRRHPFSTATKSTDNNLFVQTRRVAVPRTPQGNKPRRQRRTPLSFWACGSPPEQVSLPIHPFLQELKDRFSLDVPLSMEDHIVAHLKVDANSLPEDEPDIEQQPSFNATKISNQTHTVIQTIRNDTGTAVTFEDLPLEVRNMIYTFVMDDLPTRIILQNWVKPFPMTLFPRTLPSICFTSRTIWREAVLAYIRRTRFIIHGSVRFGYTHQRSFMSWLSQFSDHSGFKAVRMLSYTNLIRFYDASMLFSQCAGLRSLILEISLFDVMTTLKKDNHDLDESTYECAPLPIQELKERFPFEGLFTMMKLRQLKVICLVDNYIPRIPGINHPNQFFDNLLAYLKEGFKARGEKMEISSEYVEVDDY